ncbi:MAG: hypothetical protein IKZ81_00175 [Clostridia bacterium]|nr:hypothetical protein [Clostridia bacterium]
MRRLLASVVFAFLLLTAGCKKNVDIISYLSMPFESRAKLTIESSEYYVNVQKGGANLVSVTVVSPEALAGLTVSLGEQSELTFNGVACSEGMPFTAAELIREAFDARNVVSAVSDGETAEVYFAASAVAGKLRLDAFSAVPLSLEADGIYMEFTDFKR